MIGSDADGKIYGRQIGLRCAREGRESNLHPFSVSVGVVIAFQMWLEDHGKNKRSWQEDVRRYKLYIEIPFGSKTG